MAKVDDLQGMMRSASRNARYSKPYNGRVDEDNDTDMEKEIEPEDKGQRMRKKPAKNEEDREQRLKTTRTV